MKITRRQLREIIVEMFKGNQQLPRDRADMMRGVRHLGVVHAGPIRSKKQPSGDAIAAARSNVEKLRYALSNIPFDEYGNDYIRPVKDTIEKFGVDSDDAYAWFEWYQQSEGGMNAWHVKNTIPDYTTVPSHWPTKWLKYPGKPEGGFYKH